MFTAEALENANKKINSVPIKGKNYAQVSERIKAFRGICPGGRITTEIISLENGVVTMKATINDDDGKVIASGFAQEKETSSFINKTSFIENCETSAVGRALGFAGIGVDGSMASADEVANAILQQEQAPAPKKATRTGYPERQEMLDSIYPKYPRGSKNYAALIASLGVDDLENADDAKLMAVYNKVTSK